MNTAPAFGVEEVLAEAATDPAQDLAGCVSVIIPVYNEIDRLEELLELVRRSPVEKEITSGACATASSMPAFSMSSR